MSKRGKSVDAALDDLGQFMAGQRDFSQGVLFDKNKPPLWQAGYRHGIRVKKRDFGDDMITLRERLLISKARPRSANLIRGRAA